jgi:hypothetical protein
MSRRPYRSNEPAIRDHQEWLGYLQPNGLVVSPQVLFDQQVIVDRANLADLQRKLLAALAIPPSEEAEPRFGPFLQPQINGTPDGFAIRFLEWHANHIDWNTLERQNLHASATVTIPELAATLSPTAALRYPTPTDPEHPYQLLIEEVEPDAPLDDRYNATHLWETTRSAKFERLLTESGVALGVLSNGKQIRLFYAPRGETAGHLTFDATHMTGTAGRMIVGGLYELLKAYRLTNAPTKSLLPSLCETSRKYQSTVSAALAEQVLEALFELVRGFQSANDATHGELLKQHLAGDDDAKQDVYRGLLRTLMRMVFLLFAEDRDLLPAGDLYYRNYSLHGLFERLREDDGRHHDTMDNRYGAWAQLLALFRLIYRGSPHPSLSLPARHGYLFDPDAFPFLEGRTLAAPKPPLVSDGCVYRVLEKLLLLKGEKLSYRTLDVEQIGSVYETMMGFRMTVAQGASITIKPKKKGGAPIGLDLDAVLAQKPADRAKFIEDAADIRLTANHKKALKDADTHDALVAALDSRVAHAATPRIVPKGAMLLQPSDERRRSGSHYTPRSLTQPIVAKTLEPILARLGPEARPDQILDLKICDPAMGSGAFLVEVCRQLGKRLEDAWTHHTQAPRVTAQDDLTTLARRMVAQRCVYGVDRNDMAVDLAKLSLWLATLAKDHPFTFLDHALRHGDSLVGLDRAQLEAFHWDASQPKSFVSVKIAEKLQDAIKIREEIRRADDSLFREEQLKSLLEQSEKATAQLKLAGDLVIAAFFSEEKDKARAERLKECAGLAQEALAGRDPAASERAQRAAAAIIAKHGLAPFHWGIVFPEVFTRAPGGFEAMVGNPPFLGGSRITEVAGNPLYQDWLKAAIATALGQVDLCVFFFRRAYALIQSHGTLGLVGTSAISHGDNRAAGLGCLIAQGGTIFAARTAMPWPGNATVLVSVSHIMKGPPSEVSRPPLLNGRKVPSINSRLQAAVELDEPLPLAKNDGLAHIGTSFGGAGFVLERSEALEILAADATAADVVLPLTGGDEVNAPLGGQDQRFVISFGRRSLPESQKWPRVLEIVERRVLPQRLRAKDHGPGNHGKKYWWQHVLRADPLYRAIRGHTRCVVMSRVSTHHALRFETTSRIFNEKVFVFAFDDDRSLGLLQSQVHEIWSHEFSSRHGAAINYSVSKAFRTFPFPNPNAQIDAVRNAASEFLRSRERSMLVRTAGLTSIYNLINDPSCADVDITTVRRLAAAMDCAVLDAYGWTDIKTDCGFFADYTEEDEDGNEVEKSIRYRWPDEVRDEVLARLLALNAERHAEEVKLGLVSPDGERLKRTVDDEDGDADAKPTKASRKKSPADKPTSAKGKNANLTGQLDFGGDE